MPPRPSSLPFLEMIQDPNTKQALRFLMNRLDTVQNQVAGPTQGTLNPDQKPTDLTDADTGTLFFATDFNRTYRWNGSGWEDPDNAPPRGQVSFFNQEPSPATGWARCNGQTVNLSTPDGRTVFFQLPNVPFYNGQIPFMRL